MRLSHRSTQLWFKTSRPSQNTFICHRCRCLTQISQFTTTRQARASPEGPQKPDLTTRLRRRIWGTDTPPGQKDPYRRLTPEEKAAELLEQESVGDGKHNASHDTATEVARRQSAGEYLPAQNWDGLERIGGATGWWEEEWDRNNVYRGFLTEGVFGEKIANVEDVVRRVAVEILALKQAGVTLHECAQAEWSKEELIENIDIVKNEDGSFALREQTPDLIDELVEVLQSSPETDELETDELETEEMETDDLAEEIENPEEDPEAMEAEEQRLLDELNAEEEAAAAEEEQTPEEDEIPTVATTKTHDPIYLELPLTDIAFKFALIKRLTYLTGTRIPDPKINSSKTLGDVVAYLSEKPKPTKLAEILREIPELKALPNVEIYEAKRNFVQKEMEIGRWKVIEAELKRRGLPVRKSDRAHQ